MTAVELEECINIYGKDIYSFCRQLTNSRQEADELYQDMFLKAVEVMERIDAESNPKSYLLSIAVKLWKNRKRKYAWRKRIADIESLTDEKQDYYRNAEHSPEEIVEEQEKYRILKEKVKELNERYRIPVYLYYMEELSLKEISRLLRIPEGTVKSRLFKAREILKEKLEVEYYEG